MKKLSLLFSFLAITLSYSYSQSSCDSTNVTAGSASISNESACAGDSIALDLSGFSTGTGLTFQWETSPDSLTWTAISGADSSFHAVDPISGGTHYYRAYVNCGTGSDTSNVVKIIVGDPQVLTSSGDSVCGAGNVSLHATANPGDSLRWYSMSTGGSMLGTGSPFTTYISSDSTFYVEAVSGGGSGVTALPPPGTNFNGNVRGYWFTAPVSFNITGLRIPGATNNQSIAVVRFVPAVPPPVYSTTTNNFVTLFLTQSNPNTGVIPVNISISAGDVIGVLGQHGNTTIYSPGPYTTYIDGNPMTLTRMGMQFSLATTAPQDLWQESAGANNNIGLVEITYSAGCTSPRVAVQAITTPAPTVTVSASSTYICDTSQVTLSATSSNSNYIYTWQPGSMTGSSVTPTVNGTTTYVVEAYDSICYYTDSIQIVMSPPINSFITSSPSNFPSPNCNGTVAAYPTGGTPPFTILWNTPTTNNVCQGWYTATITDAAGCVKIDSVFVGLTTGIEDLSNSEISVYPNPVMDQFFIEFANETRGEMKIYDLLGKEILNQLVNEKRILINFRDYSPGLYILEINKVKYKLVKE